MALKNYEIVMVYSLSKGEEAVNALKTKFTDLISKNGTLGEVEEWGKRKLAYPINKKEEGYYVVVDFKGNPTLPKELDRRLKISDNVIRHIILSKDEK